MVHVFKGNEVAKVQLDALRMSIRLNNVRPVLATILVGNDPASELYVNLKRKRAKHVGIEMDVIQLPENVYEKDLKAHINRLDVDDTVHGIMIQLPLPGKLIDKTDEFLGLISIDKDVDGLREESKFTPATVKGIVKILDHAKSFRKLGRDSLICVVGSKGMVGKQLVRYLSESGYEVIGLDIEDTREYMIEQAKNADVIISATGKPGLIDESFVKKGAVLIDVGSPDGDFDFDSVKEKTSFITPVPGGVGPMTIVSLLENVFEASVLVKKI